MSALTLHASAVSVAGRACMIVGDAGTGKSTLALEMIARGARLISDDRTIVTRDGETLRLTAPPSIAGLVEARGIGLLRLENVTAPLALIVDLDRAEAARLPPPRHRHLLGLARPVILGKGRVGLAAILGLILENAIEAAR